MTMRATLPGLLLLVGLSTSGFNGAKAADASDPNRCQALAANFGVALTFKTAAAVGTDGCDFNGVTLKTSSVIAYGVDRVSLRRFDFSALARKEVPLSARIEAHGIRFSPQTSSKLTNFTASLMAKPFEIVLDYDMPQGGSVLTIRELSMRGARVGDVHLSGEIANVDTNLQDMTPDDPIGRAALKSLSAHIDNNGFVESFVAIPLASALLRDADDPAARLEELKQFAAARAREILAAFSAKPATVQAVTDFIAAFPHPDKPFDLTISLSKPLGMADAAALAEGPLPAMPAGDSVEASYGR